MEKKNEITSNNLKFVFKSLSIPTCKYSIHFGYIIIIYALKLLHSFVLFNLASFDFNVFQI